MAEIEPRIYPVGIQSFEKLRKDGFVYIDKTRYISDLINSASNYIFLSRPRRFGKSLLTSTLHCYFAGRRELFEGLYIADVEKEWTQYPVLHFDMSQCKRTTPEAIEEQLDQQLQEYEDIYGRNPAFHSPNTRLRDLIIRAYKEKGQRVVLLIDEYDAPMMEALADEDALKAVRQVMRNFYSPIKACDPYLRFVFLTGITKFSQMSIFSELNNLWNISMVSEFDGICGITKEELLLDLSPDIDLLAQRMGETPERMRERLREHYDGYHFAKDGHDIFNPYSLMTAFRSRDIGSYWFDTATPKFLIDLLRKSPTGLHDISGRWIRRSAFDVAAERPTDLMPLLYQTGYLTIKAYDPEEERYLLEMPNNEVRSGMTDNLIEGYVNNYDVADYNIRAMRRAIKSDDLDGAFRAIQDYLATKPYLDQAVLNEAYFQDMLFVILTMLGCKVDMEVRSSMGRIDMVLYRPGRIYVMELKINATPEEAIKQIDDRAYDRRFSGRQERIIKVGISFSTAERNITGWVIEDEA